MTMTSEIKTAENTLFDTGSVIDGKWVLIERIGKGGNRTESSHPGCIELREDGKGQTTHKL
jgi:hypothetical protein